MVAYLCPSEVRLEEAFSSMRAAALRSAATARRLTAVGVSFSRRQHQQRLRTAFINTVLQDTLNKLELLQRGGDLKYLINAANLMGDYFAETRLSNGSKMAMLAAPLLRWLRALLAFGEPRSYRALATQLLRNGRDLSAMVPQELEELSIAIRLQLLSPPSVGVTCLFLSADLCLTNFGPFPKHLEMFYSSQLNIKWDGICGATESLTTPAREPMSAPADNVRENNQTRSPANTSTLQARLDLNTWRENLNSGGSSDMSDGNNRRPNGQTRPPSTPAREPMSEPEHNFGENYHTRPPTRSTTLQARSHLNTWRENLNSGGSSSEAMSPYHMSDDNIGQYFQTRPPIRSQALAARLDLNTFRENLRREEA